MEYRCQTFVTSLVNSSEESIELASITVALEFFDAFLEILLGIPLPREVEFIIDIAPSTKPISNAPCQIA